MQYVQNAKSYLRSYAKRIFITSAFLITVMPFTCLNRVEAQCTVCPLPTFQPPVSYSLQTLGYPYYKIVAGDFNNDGKPDIVVLEGGSGVELFMNNGSGGFGAPISIVPQFEGDYATAMAIGDFNNDGNLDLVIGDYGNSLAIRFGDGTGHFGQPFASGDICAYLGSMDLAVGDLNHDNKLDVYYEHACGDAVFFGNGITFDSHQLEIDTEGQAITRGLVLADFNNDGNLDVLENRYPLLRFGDGTGGFQFSGWFPLAFANPLPPHVTTGITGFAAGDFNGDGKLDFATSLVTVHLGDGTGNFAPGTFYDVGSGGQDVKSADLNGDSILDLVTVGEGNVSVLLGKGDGTFGSLTSSPGAGSFFGQRMTIADFNGDGKPDIAEMGINEGVPVFTVLLNSTYQTPVGTNSTVVVNNTTFTFDDVTAGGTTSVTPIDPASVGQVPGGFAVSNSVAYEIGTTATFTGSVTLAFKVPGPISQEDFNSLAILHNVNGTLVDVTASTPARDYANLTIYATTTSFSPFYLARRGSHIRSLFDQTKAYKSGSTIPVKLQLQSASNANISSANTSLVARDLRLISNNTTAPVIDSGNANPDYTFRYDATLGGAGGGYIFNLSTRGLGSGQYVLSFYAGSDHSFFYTVKFEVK